MEIDWPPICSGPSPISMSAWGTTDALTADLVGVF